HPQQSPSLAESGLFLPVAGGGDPPGLRRRIIRMDLRAEAERPVKGTGRSLREARRDSRSRSLRPGTRLQLRRASLPSSTSRCESASITRSRDPARLSIWPLGEYPMGTAVL